MPSVPVPILLFLGHSLSFACCSPQRVATARRSSLKPGAVTTSERGTRLETGGARPSTAHASAVAFPPAAPGVALPVASALAEAAVNRQPARASVSAAHSRMPGWGSRHGHSFIRHCGTAATASGRPRADDPLRPAPPKRRSNAATADTTPSSSRMGAASACARLAQDVRRRGADQRRLEPLARERPARDRGRADPQLRQPPCPRELVGVVGDRHGRHAAAQDRGGRARCRVVHHRGAAREQPVVWDALEGVDVVSKIDAGKRLRRDAAARRGGRRRATRRPSPASSLQGRDRAGSRTPCRPAVGPPRRTRAGPRAARGRRGRRGTSSRSPRSSRPSRPASGTPTG